MLIDVPPDDPTCQQEGVLFETGSVFARDTRCFRQYGRIVSVNRGSNRGSKDHVVSHACSITRPMMWR